MIRYWFEFGERDIAYGIGIGCGVTALNYPDAISILNEKMFKDRPLPNIKNVIEDVDVSSLDSGHVLSNMNPPNLRGIWFPLGYN